LKGGGFYSRESEMTDGGSGKIPTTSKYIANIILNQDEFVKNLSQSKLGKVYWPKRRELLKKSLVTEKVSVRFPSS